MGLGKWWLTHGPGSPGSMAKAMAKDYVLWREETPGANEDELLALVLATRINSEIMVGFQDHPPLDEQEQSNIISNIDGYLNKLVLYIVHRENQEADITKLGAPDIYAKMLEVIDDVVAKFINSA